MVIVVEVWYHILACIRGGRFYGETQISRGDAWLLPNYYKVIIVTVMVILLAFVSPYIIYIQCIREPVKNVLAEFVR